MALRQWVISRRRALGVDANRLVVVVTEDERAEMEHVVEVIGEIAEVALPEIDGTGDDAELVDLAALRRIAEPRDAPHLVVGCEVACERVADVPRRSGQQDLRAAQHIVPSGIAAWACQGCAGRT